MRILFTTAVVWLGLTIICNSAPAAVSTKAPGASKPYRADRILIQPKPGTGLAALSRFHSGQRCKLLGTFTRIKNLQVLQVPAGQTVESLLAKYRRSGLVEFAEPDYFGHVFDLAPPNPVLFTNPPLPSLNKPNEAAFTNGTLWGLNAISAPLAWDLLTDATNLVVAVLDTGVRYTHQDLAANMWVNPRDGGHGWNALNGNNDPSDAGTHGTMVTGVLGAAGNNNKGVVGVAWRMKIMACACFNGSGIGNVSDVIACLDYARTNGARIINASWGFTNSLALSNAMVSLRDAGIIVVAACGNSATNIDVTPTYPASYALDNIVTVASTSKADVLSAFSNYGATSVDLAAPGEQIYTTFPATDSFYYTDVGGGTSYSAPYVAGACALLMAQYPADSYQQIISRLLSATDPLPSLTGKCRTGGRLNLRKALRTILVTAMPATNGSPFRLRVSGGLNRTCSVEASTNLTTWTPILTTDTSTNGTFDFADAQSANTPRRFFRANGAP